MLAIIGLCVVCGKMEAELKLLQLVFDADVRSTDTTNEKMAKLIKFVAGKYKCEDNNFFRRMFSRGYLSVLRTGHGNCVELTDLLEKLARKARVSCYNVEKIYLHKGNEINADSKLAQHCALWAGEKVYDVAMECRGKDLGICGGWEFWRARYVKMKRMMT